MIPLSLGNLYIFQFLDLYLVEAFPKFDGKTKTWYENMKINFNVRAISTILQFDAYHQFKCCHDGGSRRRPKHSRCWDWGNFPPKVVIFGPGWQNGKLCLVWRGFTLVSCLAGRVCDTSHATDLRCMWLPEEATPRRPGLPPRNYSATAVFCERLW